MTRKLYQHFASTVAARINCQGANREWFERHTERLGDMASEYMPSGSGFDSGTKIDLDHSTANRLVFLTSFHHMNDGGYYDGWTEHQVIITPSLTSGFELRITGRDKRQIKEYIAETFDEMLHRNYQMTFDKTRDVAVLIPVSQ